MIDLQVHVMISDQNTKKNYSVKFHVFLCFFRMGERGTVIEGREKVVSESGGIEDGVVNCLSRGL